jgi:small subunit ribosomal protein S8
MTMTDPIADMLTRIRNGNVAMHDEVVMPSSKLKEALAALLEREGYIAGFRVEGDTGHPGRKLIVVMKYTPERKRTITGIKRVSKPGLRVYSKADSVGSSAAWASPSFRRIRVFSPTGRRDSAGSAAKSSATSGRS